MKKKNVVILYLYFKLFCIKMYVPSVPKTEPNRTDFRLDFGFDKTD